ncbi:MAG: hypothetical protein GY950_12800 [bacterium]|nr:hypothetical protein [bacterium]
MNNLKNETLNKCFSLLREFINDTSPANNRKGLAALALNQLERVTAGTAENSDCLDTPLADGAAGNGSMMSDCLDTPLADGAPPSIGG